MRRILFLAAFALLAAAPARAQTADTARVDSLLSAICPGAHLRLYLRGDSLQGVCGPVMDGRLVVRHRDGERDVALESVNEVWVEERMPVRGALIGAGVGAGVLTLAAVIVTSAFCYSSECGSDYALAVSAGVLVGGTGGGLLGGGIGYLTKQWKRRHP